ncbi:DUF1343 domain-containing protein [Lentisphaerota bacterium WC36G]|nr:DUF1343 domain-containing protein [Lentisphaerae bacterium WC36]
MTIYSTKKLNFMKKFLFCICLTILTANAFGFRSSLSIFLNNATNLVKGKRVGLITNPTGVNSNLLATVDLLKANPNVNLVALFAPEHGIRGNIEAGKLFPKSFDKATGLPVYSMYNGPVKQPSPQALSKVDVLIYSIQDVGSRAYTYIWHLAECMKAAKKYGKTIIVLDVPNPLANIVDGPVSEKKHLSFIGLYPIPRVYGMTVGELARYLKGEEGLDCKLYVIKMGDYKRSMSWENTKLPWVPTSPHIPSVDSAITFAATGILGETGQVSTGIGYTLPFQCVANPWIDPNHMAYSLNILRLPGVRFRPIHYKPYYAAFKGQNIQGVQIHVTDSSKFMPTTTEVAIMCYLQKYYPTKFKWLPKKFPKFDKAMGTSSVRYMIQKGYNYQQIVNAWTPKLNEFKRKRAKYLLYK